MVKYFSKEGFMEYYYDSENDFYVIKLNRSFNQAEYMKILKDIIYNEKRGFIHVYYTTLTKNNKYVVLDFQKRRFDDNYLTNLIENKKRVK